MVKLNCDYIINKVLKVIYANDKEKADGLRKVNHLCLSNKFIHEIEDLSAFVDLAVLYVHENRISKIENLDYNLNLTHLYLQHNEISKIENLNHLHKLRKLFLGHNKITVVESLEGLNCLEELHIDRQILPVGEFLYFDPRTVKALSKTLRILDISNNQILTLEDLQDLQAIEEVDASSNMIADLVATCKVISHWRQLETLHLEGNPVSSTAKYAEKITAFTQKLRSLDGRGIKEETRNFLQRFEIAKAERQRALDRKSTQFKFSADIKSLAAHLPPGIRSTISQSVLKETVPSINNLTLSFQQLPTIKELPLERRTLFRNIKKTYNNHKGILKQEKDPNEMCLLNTI